MISRDDAIRKIERPRKTHIHWAEYFKEFPDKEGTLGRVGSRQHHLDYIADYDSVLELLRSLPDPPNQGLEIDPADSQRLSASAVIPSKNPVVQSPSPEAVQF